MSRKQRPRNAAKRPKAERQKLLEKLSRLSMRERDLARRRREQLKQLARSEHRSG